MLALVRELAARGARLARRRTDARWYDAAGEKGHTSVLQLALDAGEPPANCVPTLRLAAKAGHAGTVGLLLQRMAAAGVQHDHDDMGVTWYEAAVNRHPAVLVAALAEGAPLASMAGALRLAAQGGCLEAVRMLLDAGVPAEVGGGDGGTWHELAAMGGHESIVGLALQHGVPAGSMGHALSLAGGAGKAAVVQLLLEAGAPVNARSNSGKAWYVHAADFGHAAILQLALEHGAPPASLTSALEDAVRLGRADVVRTLLAGGVPLPASGTCYDAAAEGGHAAVLEALLDSGAVPPERLQAALHRAVEKGQVHTVGMVRMLHERGVPAADASGRTWYEAAAARGHTALLQLAIDDLGIPPSDMARALDMALSNMHAGAVSLLLERGVPAPPTPDAEWCERAAEGGHMDVLRLAIDSLGVPPASLAGALRVAIVNGWRNTTYLLLARGVPAHEVGDIEWDALGLIGRRRYDVLRLALDAGVPPTIWLNALRSVTANNRLGVLNWMLDEEMPPTALSPALTFAANFGNPGIVRLLLSRGVPPPEPNWLQGAAERGHADVLAVAQEYGFVPPGLL